MYMQKNRLSRTCIYQANTFKDIHRLIFFLEASINLPYFIGEASEQPFSRDGYNKILKAQYLMIVTFQLKSSVLALAMTDLNLILSKPYLSL